MAFSNFRRLPLFQLSHGTSATIQGPVPWTHLKHGELYALVDRAKGTGLRWSPKDVLKLVHNGSVLEQIDLEDLVSQVRLDEAQAPIQQIRKCDRNVLALVRRPIISLRYRLPSGESRKVQMNFEPESGYDVMLGIFQPLGIPLLPGEPTSRPNTASSQPTSAGLSIGATSQPFSQYSSISNQSYLQSNQSHAQHDPYLQGPSGLDGPSRFGIPISGWESHRSMVHGLQSHGFVGARETVHNPSPVPFVGSTTLQPSQSDRGQTSYRYGVLPPSSAQDTNNRPATAPYTLTQLMPPPRDLPFGIEASPTRSAGLLGLDPGPSKDGARPKATPKIHDAQSTSFASSADQLALIPRRSKDGTRPKATPRIPAAQASSFAKPRTRPPSRQAKEKDQPLQPLSKPKAVTTKPASKRKAVRDASPPPLPPPPPQTTAPSSSKGKGKKQSAPPKTAPMQQKKSHILRSSDPSPASNDASAEPPPVPQEEPRLEQRGTLQSISGNSSAQPPIINDAMSIDPSDGAVGKDKGKGSEPLSEPLSENIPVFPGKYAQFFEKITPEECQDRLDAWLRNYKNVAVPTAPAAPVRHVLPAEEREQMARYAAQPEEVRLEIIDDMIMEMLEDDSYVALAEDLAKSWKRIGLDM